MLDNYSKLPMQTSTEARTVFFFLSSSQKKTEENKQVIARNRCEIRLDNSIKRRYKSKYPLIEVGDLVSVNKAWLIKQIWMNVCGILTMKNKLIGPFWAADLISVSVLKYKFVYPQVKPISCFKLRLTLT